MNNKIIDIVGIAISIALAALYFWDGEWLFGVAWAMFTLWELWALKCSK